MNEEIKYCKYCGEPFVAMRKDQLYCDKSCRRSYYHRQKNPLDERICEYCEEVFIPKHNSELCCSKVCAKELNNIKTKKLLFKLKREHPELYYDELGSKGTSKNCTLYRDENGEPDWTKELEWVQKEKKRLGLR